MHQDLMCQGMFNLSNPMHAEGHWEHYILVTGRFRSPKLEVTKKKAHGLYKLVCSKHVALYGTVDPCVAFIKCSLNLRYR